MNNLQQVIDRAKADIAKKYVFVHMPIPQLETLLNGLEEQQREIEILKHDLFNARSLRDFAVKFANEERDQLRAEHTAMKGALGWYADNTNYHPYRFMSENGSRARAALSTLSCTD